MMNKREVTLKSAARQRSARVVRQAARNTTNQLEPLYPPEIDPNALAPRRGGVPADGLLRESIRNQPLRIDTPISTDPNETVPGYDEFQLLFNGVLYGASVQVQQQHLDNGVVPLEIAAADRVHTPGEQQTLYQVSYRKWKGPPSLGYYTDYPTPIQFIVDLLPPGPTLSHPEIDSEIVKNGLTSAKLTELGDKLKAEIYSYGGHALGDDVYLIVSDSNNEYVATNPITRDDISGPLFVDYLRALIEQVDDGPVKFQYRIQDRAGNMSTDSDPTIIRVLLKAAIDDLEAPDVPIFSANDIIVDADARSGVLVEIPFHDRIEAGDQIVVNWGGRKQPPADLLPVDLQDPLWGPGGGVAIQYSEVQAALNGATRGTVDVSYEVLRGGLSIGTSPALPGVLVDLTQAGGPDPDPGTPENELLQKPTIRPPSDTGDDNEIPPDQFGQNATALIPWENTDGDPAFEEDDEIQVWWGGVAALASPYVVTDADVTNEAIPPLTVLGTVIDTGGSNPAMPVQYTATRALQPPPAGQSNTARSPIQPVDVQSLDDLPGGQPGLRGGDFYQALGTVGNRVITLAVAAGGTPFRVESYLNQAENDSVHLVAQAYLGLTGETTPVGDEYEATLSVAAGKETEPVDFPVPQGFFLIPELDAGIGHVVVKYTVTQDKPKPIPVTSRETRAVIDVRGWNQP
ncbi:hypothetical protein ACVHYJ_17430 [Burkholderia pyrrocinia]